MVYKQWASVRRRLIFFSSYLSDGDDPLGDLDGKTAADSDLFLFRDGVSEASVATTFLGLRHLPASFDLGLVALPISALSDSTSAERCSALLATLLSRARTLSATTRASAFSNDDDFADLGCFLGVRTAAFSLTLVTAPPGILFGVSNTFAFVGGVLAASPLDWGYLLAADDFLGLPLSRQLPLLSTAGLFSRSALSSLFKCCCLVDSCALVCLFSPLQSDMAGLESSSLLDISLHWMSSEEDGGDTAGAGGGGVGLRRGRGLSLLFFFEPEPLLLQVLVVLSTMEVGSLRRLCWKSCKTYKR